ncbi:MAG: hypothetical protein V3S55_09590 [Nitrospiraceae bacterium]
MPKVIVNWEEEADRMERIRLMWLGANACMLTDHPRRSLNALASMAKQLSLLCSERVADVQEDVQVKP